MPEATSRHKGAAAEYPIRSRSSTTRATAPEESTVPKSNGTPVTTPAVGAVRVAPSTVVTLILTCELPIRSAWIRKLLGGPVGPGVAEPRLPLMAPVDWLPGPAGRLDC